MKNFKIQTINEYGKFTILEGGGDKFVAESSEIERNNISIAETRLLLDSYVKLIKSISIVITNDRFDAINDLSIGFTDSFGDIIELEYLDECFLVTLDGQEKVPVTNVIALSVANLLQKKFSELKMALDCGYN
jgi:hypothetical protein